MSDFESKTSSISGNSLDVLWPSCAYIGGGECVAHAYGRHLGPGISKKLAEFIGNAEPGARLTLQKSKDGFTLQITSEVIRPEQGDDVRLTELAAMSQAMSDRQTEVGVIAAGESVNGSQPSVNGAED